MKTRLFFVLAATALLASCAKEEKAPVAPVNNDGVFAITVSLPAEARTYMGAADAQKKHKVYWSNGDAIAINKAASSPLSGLADGSATATFEFASQPSLPYSIVYPASIVSGNWVELPNVQTYKDAGFADGMLPMCAYSETGSNIVMYPMCAILKISIARAATDPDTDDIVAVRFKGRSNEKVSGLFSVSYDAHKLSAETGSGDELEVKVVKRQALPAVTDSLVYYVVVPARLYNNGFDVIVQDASGHIMTQSKTASAFLDPGHLYAMPKFEFVPTGTEVGVQISSAEELIDFAKAFNRGDYAGQEDLLASLTQDISFDATTSASFNETGGIGRKEGELGATTDNYFFGAFNGAGHKISGFAATVPLFAYVDGGGVVENLTLDNTCSLTVGTGAVRGVHAPLVGRHKGELKNCTSNASVTINNIADVTTAEQHYGALVGRNYGGTIDGCTASGNITCSQASVTITDNSAYFGGIAGSQGNKGEINDCDFTGNITISDGTTYGGITATGKYFYVGGIVGYMDNGTVSSCDAASEANPKAIDVRGILVPAIGGIVGWAKTATDSEISDCNNYMSLSFASDGTRQATSPARLGGIAARGAAPISGSTNSGAISTVCNSTSVYLGGISGEGANISYCTNNAGGKVTRTNQLATTQANRYMCLGGIVGANSIASTVDHCTNKADILNNVPGTSTLTTVDAGGIMGWGQYQATILFCDNSGNVQATDLTNTVAYPRTAVGGILGSSSAANTVIRSCSNSAQIYCNYKGSTKKNGRSSYVGGIAGAMAEFDNYDPSNATKLLTGGLEGFEIVSCQNTGTVYNRNYNNSIGSVTETPLMGGIVGVICGKADSKAEVRNCNSSVGTVNIYRGNAGGIVGYASDATIQKDTSSMTSTGAESGSYGGGIVGWSVASSTSECVYSGTINTVKFIGGLIGLMDASSSISTCKVDGATLTNSANTAATDKTAPAVLVSNAAAGATISGCGVKGTLDGVAITLSSNMVTTGDVTPTGTYLLD